MFRFCLNLFALCLGFYAAWDGIMNLALFPASDLAPIHVATTVIGLWLLITSARYVSYDYYELKDREVHRGSSDG